MRYFTVFSTWLFVLLLLAMGCHEESVVNPGDDPFFKQQNEANNGDYLAAFPLSSPDSCIARLKAEVPAQLQPWACLSIWYHLPRTNPAVNFRLLELYEQNYPHDTVFAFTQMMRGEFYVDLAKFDSAKICLTDAHDKYIRLGRPLDASDATYLMARSYVYQNNFADALRSYFEVLDLLNVHDTTFSHRRAYLYQDISVVYERSSNLPQELSWRKKMWDADPSRLDKPWQYKIKAASGLAIYYLKVNPDSSLYWTNTAIDMFKKNNEGTPPPPRLVYWLARGYFKKGDCTNALPYFLDAYRRNPEKTSLFGYYQYAQALGECYLCVEKLDSAEYYLRQVLSSPDTGNVSIAYNLLRDVHTKRGDYKNALSAANESRRLFEIKFTADKVKAMAEIEARYENAQHERRIAELEQNQKSARQQNLIITLSLLLILGLILALFLRQRGRRRMLEQENLLLEQEKQLAEAHSLLKHQELERSLTDLQISKKALKTTHERLEDTVRLLDLKNRLIEELEMKLTDRHLAQDHDFSPAENNAFRSMKILTDDDWERFRQQFELSFPGFIAGLKNEFPTITAAEIRLFLLLKLGFDNKEIAGTLGISSDSVLRSRHRLRVKLELTDTRDLDSFIMAFE